jgi:chromatin remodeling complex protein RSC6
MSRGYVYVLINSLMPDVLKIGMTTLNPNERARQLRTTGVPVHFSVAYSEEFLDCEDAEKSIHDELKIYRTTDDREFFHCSLKIAITSIQNLKHLESTDVTSTSTLSSVAEKNYSSLVEKNPGQLFLPGSDLARVVGDAPLTRSKVISSIWAYVLKNKLSDPEHSYAINCDEALKGIFGGDSVTKYQMLRLIDKNLEIYDELPGSQT